MSPASLPRPAVKYLEGLPAALRAVLTPRVEQVHQALLQGATPAELLELVAALPLPDPAALPALVEALARLAHPALPAALAALVDRAPSKAGQKALKKALHHLKAQGLEVPPDLVRPAAGSPVRPLASAAAPKAYLSRIDGHGSRLVILHLPRQGQSFNLFLGLCNEVEGLKDAYAMLLSNKETKKYLDQTRQDIPGELVEVPPAYALRLLEEAYQLNASQDSEAVAAYARLRPLLQERLGQDPAPELHSLLPLLDQQDPYLEQAKTLPLQEDFFSWLPLPEELAPWLEKIQAAENSPLVLSPEQTTARIESLVAEAVKELYPPARRRLLSRRLLEMAYYLDLTGRPHLARQAQAAGEDLKRERSLLERENPFLLGLLMFPLKEMYDREKEPQTPPPAASGRIITDF